MRIVLTVDETEAARVREELQTRQYYGDESPLSHQRSPYAPPVSGRPHRPSTQPGCPDWPSARALRRDVVCCVRSPRQPRAPAHDSPPACPARWSLLLQASRRTSSCCWCSPGCRCTSGTPAPRCGCRTRTRPGGRTAQGTPSSRWRSLGRSPVRAPAGPFAACLPLSAIRSRR